MQTLRFLAREGALVQNHEKLAAGLRSYVGCELVSLGVPDVREFQHPDEPKVEKHGYQPTGEAEEVPYRTEYARDCRSGDLIPADNETAEACGVKFDAQAVEKLKKEFGKKQPPKPSPADVKKEGAV